MDRTAHNLDTLRGFTKRTEVPFGIDRIVSDAQSGASRGALDAAIELGLNHGGWATADRIADDGPLDAKYCVRKCPGGFGERVAANIRHSDGTMLLSFCAREALDGRTKHAQNLAKLKRKALVHLQLPPDMAHISEKTINLVRGWFKRCKVSTLHVVGPLESKEPGIGEAVHDFLVLVLTPEPA